MDILNSSSFGNLLRTLNRMSHAKMPTDTRIPRIQGSSFCRDLRAQPSNAKQRFSSIRTILNQLGCYRASAVDAAG